MKQYTTGFIVWLSAILCTIIVFPNLALHPNTSLISVWNDGIKNYFTTLFYINYNDGLHFSGMNYPFGEHIVFTDNMPALAGPVRFLSHYFPWLQQHALGIMNLCLLFSLVLSVHFLFRILKHYKVNTIYALLSALLIAFLSPQLNRITAHYGMGIVFYIPATIYYIIQYTNNGKKRNLVYIFTVITVSAFFHLYNLVIISLFTGLYAIWSIVLNKFSRHSIRQSIGLLIVPVASLIISYGFVVITDPVKDRSSYPYEALANEATIKDILANDVPLGYLFQFITGPADPVISTEGKSYLGFVSLLLLPALMVYFLFRIWRKKHEAPNRIERFTKSYLVLLAAASSQLLFSMAIPFIFDRDFFIEQVSVFRHFRALGRFIWPFYYVIMIYCFVIIFNIFLMIRSRKQPKLAYSFLTIVIIIGVIQYSAYYTAFRKYDKDAISNYQNLFSKKETNWREWLKAKGYKTSDIQAVLGLPFFHFNSDKIWIDQGNVGRNEYELCKLSLQTGIPMVNTLLARTSWGQTFANIQLLDGPFNQKEVLNKFDDRPILIYVENVDPLNPDKEEEWVKHARFIGSWNDEIDLYTISPQHLLFLNQEQRDAARHIAGKSSETSGLTDTSSNAFFYENSFRKENKVKGFADEGILQAADNETMIVDSILVPSSSTDKMYTISIWAKCNMKDFRTPYFEIYQLDHLNKQLSMTDFHTKRSTNVIEDWFKAETNFKIASGTKYLLIKAHRGWDKPVYEGLDNLLIQPSGSIHFYKSPLRGLLLNNRPQ